MSVTRPKEFFKPRDSGEAVGLLQHHAGKALIVAGGTFIHGLVARGLLPEVDVLIDIQGLPLGYIRNSEQGLHIGAGVTFATLAAHQEIKDSPWAGALLDALSYPPPQIKNMATVGGSIASASTLFDIPVAFLSLGAVVRAMRSSGEREIPMDEFFVDYFESALEKDELLTEVLLPRNPPRTAGALIKLETNANDLAILNAGVRITLEEGGACSNARIFLGGGVGKSFARMSRAEAILQGQTPTGETLEKVSEAVRNELDPVSDHRASGAYRKAVSGVLVQRALQRALDRLS